MTIEGFKSGALGVLDFHELDQHSEGSPLPPGSKDYGILALTACFLNLPSGFFLFFVFHSMVLWALF
jgi:hypothetical protein